MKFGTDGIRGRAGPSPIDPESAVKIGRAAARLATVNGDLAVLITRDTRPSGAMLAAACAAGVAGEGVQAIDGGVVPTAALAVGLKQGRGGAGIMITASHNPWSDNGFKILSSEGRKLTEAETEQVEAWLGAPEHASAIGHLTTEPQILSAWIEALAERSPLEALKNRKIALDLAEGSATVARPWLESLPIDWVFVEGDRINDGVGSEAPGRLARAVVEQRCEAGIAVDGDADRCLLVDERGTIIHGDALAWLLATRLGVKKLAVTVMSTGALAPALPGVELCITPVGDKHLQIAMREHDIPLGCEESGHVLFADHPGGDGLLTGFRALGAALPEGALSEVLAPFIPWPRVKSKVRVSARPPLSSLPSVVDAVERGERALGKGGRVFLRYSGTEPVLRILVEGRAADTVNAVAADVERTVRALA